MMTQKQLRENHILWSLLDQWGNVRRYLHSESCYNQVRIYNKGIFKGLKQMIIRENLDSWLLCFVDFIIDHLYDVITDNPPRSDMDVLFVLLELYYDVVWDAFDSGSRIIILEGLELMVEEKFSCSWLLKICDKIRKILHSNLDGDIISKQRRPFL